MTGADLKNVNVTTSQTGQYEVAFTLTSNGAKIFGDFTASHINQVLAIVVDKKVISTPTIQGAIPSGQGVITGKFTSEEANNLAVQLRYGSLPIPLKVIEIRTVGPTLGQESLQMSLRAGAIGFLIVILFMLLYYRLPGAVADVAIIIYALITFAIFRFIPVTLTLPGIAGFLLSTGSALDANILIFERMKEELRSGKTLRQSIDLGWKRAWPSIRDSNIATIITCTILFWFGSTYGATIVKGFSITLTLGCDRQLVLGDCCHTCIYGVGYYATSSRKTFQSGLVSRRNPTMINILGKRYYFFALSLLIIIPGLILLGSMAATGKLPLAIDFTGGSLLEVRFANATPSDTDIITLYKKLGVEDVKVQTTSTGSYVIRSSVLEDSVRAKGSR